MKLEIYNQVGGMMTTHANPHGDTVGWLEFNVRFQHKYGYVRDEHGPTTTRVVLAST